MASDPDVQAASSGLGFFSVLFLVLLVLKLTHVIAWSWWWVTAPLWAPIGLGLLVLACICTLVAIFGVDER